MRIILFTGKGGVGKTTISSATAIECASRGYRTLVISTDPAHSLSDSLAIPLSGNPIEIAPNLYAQEIDVGQKIDEHWGTIQRYISSFLSSQGLDNLRSEEMSIFPGTEDLVSLLELNKHTQEGFFDVVIVDCAPTGSTMRLLSLPEVGKWYMTKVFKIEKAVITTIRPVAQRFVSIPIPDEEVYNAIESLYKQLENMNKLLTDPDICSIRLVLNAEKMVIQESQRAYTYFNIFGFPVDAIIINRLIPAQVEDLYFSRWKEIQQIYVDEILSAFHPLPILKLRLQEEELLGIDGLKKAGAEIYREYDPAGVLSREKTVEFLEDEKSYCLMIPLPFVEKKDLRLWHRGDQLILKVKNYRRNIFLPLSFSRLQMSGAKFEENFLKVIFEKKEG